MKRTGNITFGVVLLALGVILLLRNLGYLQLQWSDVFAYWYVFLILAGICLLIAGIAPNRISSGIAGVFIVLAIVGGATNGAHRTLNNHAFRWKHDWSDRDRDRSTRNFKRKQKDEAVVKPRAGRFEYDMEPAIREATFHFEGGAGEFQIAGTTGKLFEATSESTVIRYVSSIRHNKAESQATVNFHMEEGNIQLKNNQHVNRTAIQLNAAPVWTFDMAFGAGKGDFDLSALQVRRVELSTGAADIKLKLGANTDQTEVDIEAGAASVSLKVPASAGIEIRTSGILNSKEFRDFERISKNLYRSPGYDGTSKKITINYEAGLSSFEVERY